MAIGFSRAGFLAVYALVLSASIIAVADRLQGAEACELEPGERGRVAAIVDGRTLTLDTGLGVRLIGMELPAGLIFYSSGYQPVSSSGSPLTARAFLEQVALGRRVQLFYGGRRRDRHGRALAHVFVHVGDAGRRLHGDWTPANGTTKRRIWVQGRLVAAGLGLASSFADNRACMTELLDLEAVARSARRGVWERRSGQPGPVIDAQSLRDLFGARHRFQIVEGTVTAVGSVRGTTYLNFGDDWRRDFTIVVRRRAQRRFGGPGTPDLSALEGQRVRVRGWVDLRNGPFIEVDHPEQLELPGVE